MRYIPWWLSIEYADTGINVTGVDNRVLGNNKECGGVFTELWKYAVTLHSDVIIFPEIISKKNDVLIAEFKVPAKSEEERFQDLRFTIKTYRYLLPTLLSLGFVSQPISLSDNLNIEHMDRFFNYTSDVLEFYLLNNPLKINNEKSYYTGRIQLDLYRLLQEIYKLAKDGNHYCNWMLAFDTPLQIWFVTTLQTTISGLFNTLKSTREYRNEISKVEKNKQFLEQAINHCKIFSRFNVTSAIEYTIAQLVVNNTIPIGSYYTRYRQGIVKQANLLRKGKLPPI